MENQLQEKDKLELKIYFDNNVNSLFDLGYISLDVLQLIILGEMIEEDQVTRLEVMFEKKKPYGYFTRDSSLYRKYRDKIIIKELRKGSIEIVIGGVNTISAILAILVPIVIYKKTKNDETIEFQISSNDEILNKILEEYAEGCFGEGIEGFNWLNKHLSRLGYDIRLSSKDAYIIEKIAEDYGNKIIKTLKKS